eukprot:GHVT01015697.1.p1 GENE.GHVT01015697.1~~GHVT01015697.1.p1  ORF type:complete len:116 (+),score=7.94 GHVT01015697.1:74-421(+)
MLVIGLISRFSGVRPLVPMLWNRLGSPLNHLVSFRSSSTSSTSPPSAPLSAPALERVGFVGLGTMGAPMAKNLLRCGKPVVVYDTNPRAVEMLVREGALPASTLKELAQQVTSKL